MPSQLRVVVVVSLMSIAENDVDPKVTKQSAIASERPMSPTRFITNAFLAAAAADGLCCQKPISR